MHEMRCAHCAKPIAEDEGFAAIYGPAEDPMEIIGYLHMKCSEELERRGVMKNFSLQ